jgi:hypothetical protein
LKEDKEVIRKFGGLLNELTSCGGSEAQSIVRGQLHDIYDSATPNMQEWLDSQFKDHQAIVEKRIIFVARRDYVSSR